MQEKLQPAAFVRRLPPVADMRTAYAILLASFALAACKKTPSGPTVAEARAFADTQPRHLRHLPYTEVPTGLADLRAETCGACHVEIYEEWKISTHARAWLDDPQFLAELEKSEKQGVAWMCMNCHTPLENQLPKLVAGFEEGQLDQPIFVDNPAFDPELQEDAITCATCHVKDGVVLGPYGSETAPHPVKKDPSLRTVEVCTQCHQAQARFETLGLVCVFDTGAEYANSPYPEQGETCQSCHMPEVERPLSIIEGLPKRKTRRHWFGGSLIPKKPEFAAEIGELQRHYPPGLEVEVSELPEAIEPGQRVVVKVEVVNANAGHYLPTGDPERFLTIELEAKASDRVLAEREERIGIVYQWHPEVKKLSDNRLAPKEAREYTLAFEAPENGQVSLRVAAARWRISQENLEYHDLEGKYVPGQTFFERTQTRRVR